MNIKEFEIPVPWGHIAVKCWGNEENTPALMVHGLGDNAGTFDRLLPFLPTSFYYICMDLPSHGKSSPYPPHVFISSLGQILTFKLVLDHFNRQKYILMGHSWGGQIGVLFTQLFPEYVLKLIVFDSFYLLPAKADSLQRYLRRRIDTLIRINDNTTKTIQPSFSYEEAVIKLMEERIAPGLSRDSAEALLKRSSIEIDDGRFQFILDPRASIYINPFFEDHFILEFINKHPITCPALFVYAASSAKYYKHFKVIGKELLKHNKDVVLKEVNGSHDIHNNNPEIVGPLVCQFLLDIKSKL